MDALTTITVPPSVRPSPLPFEVAIPHTPSAKAAREPVGTRHGVGD